MWTAKWIHSLSVPIPPSSLRDFRFPRASTPRGCSHPQCGWRPHVRPAKSLEGYGIGRHGNLFQRRKTWKIQLDLQVSYSLSTPKKMFLTYVLFNTSIGIHAAWSEFGIGHGNSSLPGDSKCPFENLCWRSPTTFPNGHKKPSPKGHKEFTASSSMAIFSVKDLRSSWGLKDNLVGKGGNETKQIFKSSLVPHFFE